MSDTNKEIHNWPKHDEHLFGDWMNWDKSTQYRQCMHISCHVYEQRPIPKPKDPK